MFHTDPLNVEYLNTVSKGLCGKYGENHRAWCIIPIIVGSVEKIDKAASNEAKYLIAEQSKNPFKIIVEAIEKVGKEKFDSWAQEMLEKFKAINKNPYVDTILYEEL